MGHSNLLQTKTSQIDKDDSDKYMAESIAEAEKEYEESKKTGQDMFKKQVVSAEAEYQQTQTKVEMDDPLQRQENIKNLANQITDGALSTQSSIWYDGTNVDVKEMSKDNDTEEEKAKKEAIKAALHEMKTDLNQNKQKELEKKDVKNSTAPADQKKTQAPPTPAVKNIHPPVINATKALV